jgi:hypothetical protein
MLSELHCFIGVETYNTNIIIKVSENMGDFGGEIFIKIENILKCNVGDEFVVEHVVDVFMHN